jgi:hypothetical protein
MQEPKEVLRGRGLKNAFNSFVKVYNEALKDVDDYRLGTRNVLNVIEPCVKNHAEDPKFPADDLRENINNLRVAVETRNVHKVHTYREKIEESFSSWQNVPAPMIIGS